MPELRRIPNVSRAVGGDVQEDLTKHLEFVQAIVARMAGNSFLLKGWTVTLSAALFALAAKDSNPVFAVLAVVPALSFWGLDAYYLRQERLFRKLYDKLRTAPGGAAVEPFSLSTQACEREVPGWTRTLFAPSVVPLHGVVVGAAVTVIIWLK